MREGLGGRGRWCGDIFSLEATNVLGLRGGYPRFPPTAQPLVVTA